MMLLSESHVRRLHFDDGRRCLKTSVLDSGSLYLHKTWLIRMGDYQHDMPSLVLLDPLRIAQTDVFLLRFHPFEAKFDDIYKSSLSHGPQKLFRLYTVWSFVLFLLFLVNDLKVLIYTGLPRPCLLDVRDFVSTFVLSLSVVLDCPHTTPALLRKLACRAQWSGT
jgi:hypothetical protein